jgi:hypothetical protein
LQYYERKRMEIDNLGRETKKSKYIMWTTDSLTLIRIF